MEMNLYNIVYIIGNIAYSYIVYRFFHIFYPKSSTPNKLLERLAYIAYFLVLTVVYFVSNVPIVMLVCNVISFIGLSFLYNKTFLKNLFVAFIIYMILMTTETMVAFLTGYFDVTVYLKNDYSIIFGIIASKIVAYAMVLLISNFQNLKKGTKIHNSHWIFIILVPIGTLYMLMKILQIEGDAKWQEILAVIDVFALNFGVFWLYDYIIKNVSDEYERIMLKKENQYFENQVDKMEKSNLAWKKMKHDLKNHLIVLNQLVEEKNHEEAKVYLRNMIDAETSYNQEISTGNTVIDSILNYKIMEANQRDITYDLDIQIPENLNIPAYEICCILGNALDNAAEAVKELHDKKVDFTMKYTKGRVVLEIQNAFQGELNINNKNTFITKKEDIENHGFGLENIRDAVERLNGIVNINTQNQIFTLTILLFVNME